jgi:cell division protein FtsB
MLGMLSMRLIILCLTVLLLLIQYPLWLGKGGWMRVWELDKQVQQAQKKNDELKKRNAKLESEVDDLKQGTGAVEERARYELGMIKQNEVFIQILDGNQAAVHNSEPVPTGSTVAVSGNMVLNGPPPAVAKPTVASPAASRHSPSR